MKKGSLIISLDFELFWGVVDSRTVDGYGLDIIRGRQVIPDLLKLFSKYNIHATWGVVGMLFGDNKELLRSYIPDLQPNYDNPRLSAYQHFETIGTDEEDDPLHYANSLIRMIKGYPTQDIGSHTFSHYYCTEKGQTYETFRADTEAARNIATDLHDVKIRSFIFPRNYFNPAYLTCLKQNGVIAVRGNQKHYAYNKQDYFARFLRLVDSYFPICGNKIYDAASCLDDGIVNLSASVFFRKPSKKLAFLEPIKIWNVKYLMKKAAKKGKVFHIWWHPHNMGADPEAFLKQVEEILAFYQELNAKYGFESKNMSEIAEEILSEENSTALRER